jgi:flagellar hook-associated protein 3 FlgL
VTTRITQSMLSTTLLGDLESITSQYAQTQEKLSSGKELQKPSDDPFAVSRALQLRGELDANQQYQRNVQDAQGWQSATDTAMSNIGDLALRARDLVVQGANGSAGADARASIAAEIQQLIDSIKSAANTQYAGSYVLSGSATGTQPFLIDAVKADGVTPDDDYKGNTDDLAREIGDGVSMTVNTTGASAIAPLLATLRSVQSHLAADNTTALQSGDLSAIDTDVNNLTTERAAVGAVGNRLDNAMSRLQQLEESATKLLSNTEDADMAKTLVDLSQQSAVYQAALKAGTQIIQPSLIDYLR